VHTCSRCRETKEDSEFFKTKRTYNGLQAYCKPCQREYGNNYQRTNESYREKQKVKRRVRTIEHYGITREDYENLLEKQQYRCAICNTDEPGGKHNRFHIDHCHDTDKVRGLLCHHCNTAIGLLKHSIGNLTSAIDYLNEYR
jgi:rubrerythrin